MGPLIKADFQFPLCWDFLCNLRAHARQLPNRVCDFQFPLCWDFLCNRGPFGQFGARIARFGHRPGAGPRLSLNCMALYKDNRKFGIVYSIMDGWRTPLYWAGPRARIWEGLGNAAPLVVSNRARGARGARRHPIPIPDPLPGTRSAQGPADPSGVDPWEVRPPGFEPGLLAGPRDDGRPAS